MRARDFIKPGESMIVIYTDGNHLEFGEDNTGISGYWAIAPGRSVDRVLIYQRDKETNTNTLYIANHDGVKPVGEGRSQIGLAHVQYVGKTELNWLDFAEGGQNPVRYLP